MLHRIHFRGPESGPCAGAYFGTVETDDVAAALADAECMMVLGRYYPAGDGVVTRRDGSQHQSHTVVVLGPRRRR